MNISTFKDPSSDTEHSAFDLFGVGQAPKAKRPKAKVPKAKEPSKAR